jgi:hypothetical protein
MVAGNDHSYLSKMGPLHLRIVILKLELPVQLYMLVNTYSNNKKKNNSLHDWHLYTRFKHVHSDRDIVRIIRKKLYVCSM